MRLVVSEEGGRGGAAAPIKPAAFAAAAMVTLLRAKRGLALPMTMLALSIVSTVVVGFAVLSATEPTIANNQLRVTQARALAEAGVERSIWALNNPGDARGIPVTFTTAPTPYDGSQLVMVPALGNIVGGFRVTVVNGGTAYERSITAVGWVPGEGAVGPKAVQKITVTAFNPQFVVKDPPAALSVRGELRVGGNALVDARADESCGAKIGTLSVGDTSLLGSGPSIRGAGSTGNMHNRVSDAGGGAIPLGPADVVSNVSTSVFDQFALADVDLNALRALAKTRGTYLRGAVNFDEGRRMPNGLIFVDTVSGANITAGADGPGTPPADFATVDIRSDALADPGGTWSGWLIVNGSISISGSVRMRGFVYAQSSLNYHATGTGGVSGAMVSRSIADRPVSTVDSDPTGDVAITFNCGDLRTGGGTIPNRWSLKSGSYREVSGS